MIFFNHIRWKNLLSTGNQFIDIKLNKSPTTLIVGENGAGKSTILDALCFCLFGKPFRNINKPQLVNSINNKQTLVEVEFNIGSKKYLIRRGIKPNVFEIFLNDELLNQDAAIRDYQTYLEEQILKINYKSFTQIVILGSASFTPFMQLPQAHRREIIEDILDIQIFSVMNNILKDKITNIKEQIKTLDNSIELNKQKVELQQNYIKQLEDNKKKQEENVKARITETESEIENLANLVSEKETIVVELKAKISDENQQTEKQENLYDLLKQLNDKIKTAQKNIEFYSKNDTCPTCNQGLDVDHKHTVIETHSSKITEVTQSIDKLNIEIGNIEKRIEEIQTVKEQLSTVTSDIVKLNNQIIGAQAYIKKLTIEMNEKITEIDSIDAEKLKLKELAKDIVKSVKEKSNVAEDRYYHEIASSMLKDTGIKTRIIKQYLPVINKMVNKYLAAMDFFCHFELDDSFNETIKSRHRDSFSYASFSEGEKQRIDLALLFTWRTIAKMKNSVSTNLLLLDEVFDSSLDANGTDYVMQLLNTISPDTNVFVISHKGDQLFDKFRSVIKFEKYQNYSRMVK